MTTSDHPPTAHRLHHALWWGVGRAALCALGFLLVLGAGLAALGIPVLDLRLDDARDRGPSPVERLVEKHGCWTQHAPTRPDGTQVEPRHAVVTLPGQGPRLAPARVGLAIWLEGAPGVVHAFCR